MIIPQQFNGSGSLSYFAWTPSSRSELLHAPSLVSPAALPYGHLQSYTFRDRDSLSLGPDGSFTSQTFVPSSDPVGEGTSATSSGEDRFLSNVSFMSAFRPF